MLIRTLCATRPRRASLPGRESAFASPSQSRPAPPALPSPALPGPCQHPQICLYLLAPSPCTELPWSLGASAGGCMQGCPGAPCGPATPVDALYLLVPPPCPPSPGTGEPPPTRPEQSGGLAPLGRCAITRSFKPLVSGEVGAPPPWGRYRIAATLPCPAGPPLPGGASSCSPVPRGPRSRYSHPGQGRMPKVPRTPATSCPSPPSSAATACPAKSVIEPGEAEARLRAE